MTSRTATLALSGLFLAVGLAGCQRVHVGEHDGGRPPRDGGGAREQCGPVLCDQGQVCCNESCGICAPPDGACIQIACTTDCASNADCGPTEYCALDHCPDGRRDGVCVPRPEGCFTVVEPACGCDGATYSNTCEAGRAGEVVARQGACGGSCEAQDASGEGACAAILGIAWDGTRCTYIGGCSCVGADCGETYDTFAECETARSGCHSCAPQDAGGEGLCDAIVGTFWNGTECVTHSGCSCVGSDCGEGWGDASDCEIAHRHCFGPPPGCTSSADCGEGEWCVTPRGECGGVGTCEPVPPPGWACPDPGPPVCGCDGVTYGCDDHAHAVGVNVAGDGDCVSPCAADDVMEVGSCEPLRGFYWDGTSCQILSGCECVGRDCDRVAATLEECQMRHAGCERPPGGDCGGFAGLVCRPDEWCDFPASMVGCGAADELGRCRPRPTACDLSIDPVCGCDGLTHDNECFAQMAGVDVAGAGTCAIGGP